MKTLFAKRIINNGIILFFITIDQLVQFTGSLLPRILKNAIKETFDNKRKFCLSGLHMHTAIQQ